MSGKLTVGGWKPSSMRPLADVVGAVPGPLAEAGGREDHLVHARPVEGHLEGPRQGAPEPVGVEHRPLGHPEQAVAPVHLDVGEGPSQHQRVAVPAVDPADRACGGGPPVPLGPRLGVGHPDRAGAGQEVDEVGGHRDGARPRSAAAVGGGEGLVQVEVDDVEAHVARADHPQDRVEVGAVVIHEAPDLVHRCRDLDDVLLEQPEGVGVGEHHPGDVGVEHLAQRADVDAAAGVALHRGDLVAPQGHRGRVGAVGGVRDDHPVAALAAGPRA